MSRPNRSTRGLLAGLVTLIVILAVVAGVLGYLLWQEQAPGEDSAEAGFLRDMYEHHAQAVEMAMIIRDRTDDADVRQMAYDIATTQGHQAGQLYGWLAAWELNQLGSQPPMAWMGHTGHNMSALMPGMATEGELTDLRGRTGRDFDVTFLQLMIRHHQGGRDMAGYAAEQADEAAVRTLAGTIADTQAAEVTTMTDMLAARGGTSLPAP